MRLFHRGAPSIQAAESPAYRAFRAKCTELLDLRSWSVIEVVDLPAIADPGERVEVWEAVDERSRLFSFGSALVAADGSWEYVILAGVSDGSGYTVLFTDDGGKSQHGPYPPWRDGGEWAALARQLAEGVLSHRAERRAGIDSDRTYLRDHRPLQRFLATNGGLGPKLESWVVEQTVPGEPIDGGWVELWTRPVSQGPISYLVLAAAYRPDGSIAAIASLESMPSVHATCFLGLFPEGGPHVNVGERPDLLENSREFMPAAIQAIRANMVTPAGARHSPSVAGRTQAIDARDSHERVESCAGCGQPLELEVTRSICNVAGCEMFGKEFHVACGDLHVQAAHRHEPPSIFGT